MNKLMKKVKNKKGFTLIELIVVIAILGILAAIAIPRLGGFVASADDRTDQANAKLLTNIAHTIQAEDGEYPGWDATFTATGSLTTSTAAGNDLLNETITIQNTDNQFAYDSTTGVVTVEVVTP